MDNDHARASWEWGGFSDQAWGEKEGEQRTMYE
jgi:hypothetical protein